MKGQSGVRLAAIIVLLLPFLLGGCSDLFGKSSPDPSASETSTSVPSSDPSTVTDSSGGVTAYLSAWERLDYAGMYALLSPFVKKSLTEEQFVKRYQTIYKALEVSNLVVTALPTGHQTDDGSDSEGTALTGTGTAVKGFSYHVSMDTAEGPISFDNQGRVRKTVEDGVTSWLIDWNPSFIFPGMEEGDTVRVEKTPAVRGEIVDRNGNPLAVNVEAAQLGIVPSKLGDSADTIKASMAKKLGMSVQDIDRKLGASWVKPDLFVPIAVVVDDAVRDELVALPGVAAQKVMVRRYPLGEAAAHLIGYIGEINADELKMHEAQGYKAGDMIGKTGLELTLEAQLRGTQGKEAVIVDRSGIRKSVVAGQVARNGVTYKLTIDTALQQAIYEEVKADAASVAAIQPATGEVLALLSSPSYDPNAFVQGVSKEQYRQWNEDPRHPFLNRFSRTYAPGSSFKVITAAIGLDSGALDPDGAKEISGLTWKKDSSWGKYYVKRVHDVNSVDLTKALTYSDNIYFAQTALAIGKKQFVAGAARFGIGESFPLAYPLSASQLAGGGGEPSGDIQLADSGYGQGQVEMTTLHVAFAYSALVNGGNIAYPQLSEADSANAGKRWKEQAMSAETAKLIKADLVKAVTSPEGVGHGAYIAGASIAGKTGTAELKASKGAQGQENGWFVGFDADNPQLLISMMIENVQGRGGSGYVAPKVKRIFEQTKQQ
ncbi:penicillin-binding transpeptidase domain-containing protein [Cohnella sp. AR92]|uniref:penicillin-binding transpeptidase domain-containing protein n=1 Tax=Cohnella sp. AR92 TaxID=648716 RepID=UPI000F8EBAF7|nr:penicillin-binding transpeptidase domain-containing protein [Cohnella sp. AR92]RUS46454.1 penicillin-binding transpeptidase domain-containing protein [Cohnella sp. AR92]